MGAMLRFIALNVSAVLRTVCAGTVFVLSMGGQDAYRWLLSLFRFSDAPMWNHIGSCLVISGFIFMASQRTLYFSAVLMIRLSTWSYYWGVLGRFCQ